MIMKNIAKVSYLFLVSLVALVLGACTNDFDYTPAKVSGTEVYFSNNQDSVITISKTASNFIIQLHRVDTKGELTVSLSYAPGEGNIFTVPAQVTFADGSADAPIDITYDPAKAEYGVYTGGTISVVGDGLDSTYGITTLSFKAGANEWIDIPTDKSIGKMRDDAITAIFTFTDGVPVWDVKIQKSAVKEGMYNIVNPYEDWYTQEAKAAEKDGSACAFNYDSSVDHNWVIDATDPNAVYLKECHTGLSYVAQEGVGELSLCGTPWMILMNSRSNFPDKTDEQIMEMVKQQFPQYFGVMKDGVITFPKQAVCIAGSELQEGSYLTAAKNGLFAIALPGNIIADYALTAEYQGRFTDVDNNDYATFNLTLGDDVALVKYALVASSNATATANGIIDGSVEAAEATASGSVNVAYTETGNYTLVCVIYNGAGEAVGTEGFEYKLKSSKDGSTEESYKDVASGTYTIGAKDLSSYFWQEPNGMIVKEAVEQESILSQGTVDPTKFKISPYLVEGYDLYFSVDEDGIITVEPQKTGITNDKYEFLVGDLYTWMLEENADFAAQLDKKGWHSNYNADDDVYNFILNFGVRTSKGLGDFGVTELDTYEVLDRDASAAKAAMASAKKIAAERKYIFRKDFNANAVHKSFNKSKISRLKKFAY